MKKADFPSMRGGFKFNNNGYPIQDFYLTKVAKRADGKFQTEIVAESVRELRRPLRQGMRRQLTRILKAPATGATTEEATR